MPSMTPQLIKNTATTRFRSFRITLPPTSASSSGARTAVRAVGPTAASPLGGAQSIGLAAKHPASVSGGAGAAGVGRSAGNGGSTGGRPAPPTPMNMPPALFLAASNSGEDIAYQREMHEVFQTLIDGLAEAVATAHAQWKQQARFAGVRIDGALARGGRIEGPSMEQLIRSASPVSGWSEKAGVRDAVAAGLQTCWKEWADRPKLQGLPWYPQFAAFPGPQAPPMPNIPTALLSCAGDIVPMMPHRLAGELGGRLRSCGLDYPDKFADAMAAGISAAFMAWLPVQQVMQVLGRGPVPGYAPPVAPVSPVIGGSILSTPGHIAS